MGQKIGDAQQNISRGNSTGLEVNRSREIVIVHNGYSHYGGEKAVVYSICQLMEKRGHAVVKFFCSSAELSQMRLGTQLPNTRKSFVRNIA